MRQRKERKERKGPTRIRHGIRVETWHRQYTFFDEMSTKRTTEAKIPHSSPRIAQYGSLKPRSIPLSSNVNPQPAARSGVSSPRPFSLVEYLLLESSPGITRDSKHQAYTPGVVRRGSFIETSWIGSLFLSVVLPYSNAQTDIKKGSFSWADTLIFLFMCPWVCGLGILLRYAPCIVQTPELHGQKCTVLHTV